MLVNSGAEAHRERGQDRARGDRPAGGRRLRVRVPRAHAARDDDDEQGEARTRRASGLSRPRSIASRRRTRTAASPPTTRSQPSSICSRRTSIRRPSPASCSSRCRARAGSSRCRRTTRRGSRSSAESTGSCTSTTRCSRAIGRTGKMWAIEHYDGRRARSRSSRASRSAVDSRSQASPAAPRSWTPCTPAASAARSAATRSPARRRWPCSTSSRSESFLAEARELGEQLRARLDALAARHPEIGEVRGLGPMLAFEFAERTPDRAQAVVVGGVRPRTRPPVLRALRQRDPAACRRSRSAPRSSRRVSRSWRSRLPHDGVPDVRVAGLRKSYGDVVAVDAIDLDIAPGEFFTMLGPSGSGKTTTLRMIAGFETPGRRDDRARRARTSPGFRRTTARQHGLPGLRALPAHDRAGRTSSTG